MPMTDFAALPDDARVWVFGADAPVDEVDAPRLLAEVDAFLMTWAAHGQALTCARTWRDDRFLVVGVDERASGASGCSIDALFRVFKRVEPAIGTSLLPAGQVFFRDASGLVHGLSREDFSAMASAGAVTADTPVYDLTVTTMGEYRARFEGTVGTRWHRSLLPKG